MLKPVFSIAAFNFTALLGTNVVLLLNFWYLSVTQTTRLDGSAGLWPMLVAVLWPLALWWGVYRDSCLRTYLRRQKLWKFSNKSLPVVAWIPYLFLVVVPGFYFGRNPGSIHRSPMRKFLLTLLWLPLLLTPLLFILSGAERNVAIGSRAEYGGIIGAQFRAQTEMDLYVRTGKPHKNPRKHLVPWVYVAIFDDPGMPEKYPNEYVFEQTIPAGLVVTVEKITACVGCWFDDAVYYTVVAEGLELEHEDIEVRICCGTELGASFDNKWLIEVHEGGTIEFNPKYLTPVPGSSPAVGSSPAGAASGSGL